MGASGGRTALRPILALAGGVGLYLGLAFLAFNGFATDADGGEWNTFPVAVPVLVIAVALIWVAIRARDGTSAGGTLALVAVGALVAAVFSRLAVG